MYQKQFKIISFIWGTILILVFCLLTIVALLWKNTTKEYQKIENLLVEKTNDYFQENNSYPQGIEVLTITLDDLKKSGILDEIKYKNDVCDGYIEVSNADGIVYKPYIKCHNYKTKGFDSSK